MKRRTAETREEYKQRLREIYKNNGNTDQSIRKKTEDQARRTAAKEGDWPTYLGIIDDLIQDPTLSAPMLSRSLGVAIQNDAPLWVFQDLLERGAIFNWLHMSLLASGNKVNLIRELENMGLDINITSPKGANGIYSAMQFFNAYQAFEYLLIRGVSTDNLVAGLDYLEYALKGAETSNNACIFVIGILEFGSLNVNSSHFAMFDGLKVINRKNYDCIINSSSQYWSL